MVVFLGLLARGILSEEHFGYHLEVMKKNRAAESRANPMSHPSDWKER